MRIKTLLLYFIFLCALNINSQSKVDSTLHFAQKKYFKKGERALKNSNKLKALEAFHAVCYLKDHSVINDKIEQNARKRIDSLLPFFQKKELKKWQGRWKLKQLTYLPYNYEYIEFANDKVFFYEKNSTEPARVEKVKFAPYNDSEMVSYSQLIFENTEILQFTFKREQKEKRLIVEMIREANGDLHFLLDERSIIKDPKKRKEALAKEIRTYYILEK
ncbi:hypothetical protein FSS13T_18700 [Flavobacterium saliperosum S13]|uniref:Uncharacterized protein n=2 Tax=Flavobacterium saliperosum TaxID=329186 RepID=A0A1G4W7U5_9FLAO|nr:hypothetical protein [Flavobacterium saliperosum]ESU24972.1 hypothetical protein FSS13T_18700 [Flavobacterium saliperosum S13]SCX18178.1 hypothetical protein SAMN02927925_02634 [Flavobacterium saliperosum]